MPMKRMLFLLCKQERAYMIFNSMETKDKKYNIFIRQ